MSPIFEKQWLHLLALAILLTGVALAGSIQAVNEGNLWGISSGEWLWICVASAVLHQAYVWFVWRTQLHAGLITRLFGDRGFRSYGAGFAVLMFARFASVFLLAVSNSGTISMDSSVLRIIALMLTVPVLYTFYSVARYFSFSRALGKDHFSDQFARMPLERRGIFRYTRNGMYTFGFLLIWFPGLWWASAGAVCAAIFNHIYIWVHYFATEHPDMRRIYGKGKGSGAKY